MWRDEACDISFTLHWKYKRAWMLSCLLKTPSLGLEIFGSPVLLPATCTPLEVKFSPYIYKSKQGQDYLCLNNPLAPWVVVIGQKPNRCFESEPTRVLVLVLNSLPEADVPDPSEQHLNLGFLLSLNIPKTACVQWTLNRHRRAALPEEIPLCMDQLNNF